jgi:cytoskeletal protein RodZ
MTDRENKQTQSESEKDYGFPFVEVSPLQAKSKKPGKPNDQVTHVAQPVIQPAHKEKEDRRPSNLPVLLSMIVLVVVILGTMVYFFYINEDTAKETLAFPTIEEPLEAYQEEAIEKDIIHSDTILAESVPLEKREGILVELRERSTPPKYYIIVGSLPGERIAKSESSQYLNEGKDVYLIYPFGESKNYRLSVARFADLQAATLALEETRVVYGESLWILKY